MLDGCGKLRLLAMHIFISYAKSDTKELAKEIRKVLVSIPSISVWIDESLKPTDSWAAQIEQQIDRSDLMVVLLSPDVNRPKTKKKDRSFVLKEISYAQDAQIPILLVMARKTKLPVQLAGEQYIDLTKDSEEGMRKLMSYIAHQINSTAELHKSYSKIKQIQNRYAYEKMRRTAMKILLAILAVIVPSVILALVLGTDRFADPVARFSALPREGQAPVSVVFNNTSDNATSFEWDFGDDTSRSEESDPVHIYSTAGNYSVTLKVCNSVRRCDTQTIEIAAVVHPDPMLDKTPTATATFEATPSPLEIFTNTPTSIITPATIRPITPTTDLSVIQPLQMTLFVDTDYLALLVDEQDTVDIHDLTFSITDTDSNQTNQYPLFARTYTAFSLRASEIPTPICFVLIWEEHYENNVVTTNLPQECTEVTMPIQPLNRVDMFWMPERSTNPHSIDVTLDSEPIIFCPSGTRKCPPS